MAWNPLLTIPHCPFCKSKCLCHSRSYFVSYRELRSSGAIPNHHLAKSLTLLLSFGMSSPASKVPWGTCSTVHSAMALLEGSAFKLHSLLHFGSLLSEPAKELSIWLGVEWSHLWELHSPVVEHIFCLWEIHIQSATTLAEEFQVMNLREISP